MPGPSKAELDAMVEGATIDCYDEEEQLTGLATMVEDNLEIPFKTTVFGLEVTVTGVTHTRRPRLVHDSLPGTAIQARA
jgi:hypothetical protein